MTDTTTTSPNQEQQANKLTTPWTLQFDRDGTEDFAIICDAEGNDLVASHLPSTRIAERTHASGTFWLPEEGEIVPLLVRQMRVMATAPRLLKSLIRCAELLADHDEAEGEEGDSYREAAAAIAEATDDPSGLGSISSAALKLTSVEAIRAACEMTIAQGTKHAEVMYKSDDFDDDDYVGADLEEFTEVVKDPEELEEYCGGARHSWELWIYEWPEDKMPAVTASDEDTDDSTGSVA